MKFQCYDKQKLALHLSMFHELFSTIPALRLYDIELSTDYALTLFLKKKKLIVYNSYIFCLLHAPDYLLVDNWKYGVGQYNHLQAKMHEYIRTGKHPIEYLHKQFFKK